MFAIQVQARTVLWHLAFVGFAINYLVCVNLNIAIVEMIVPPTTTEKSLTHDQHIIASSSENVLFTPTTLNYNQTSVTKLNVLITSTTERNDKDISGKLNELDYNKTSTSASGQDSLELVANEVSEEYKYSIEKC